MQKGDGHNREIFKILSSIKNKKLVIPSILGIFSLVVCIFVYIQIDGIIGAIKEYNNAAEGYNDLVIEYNETIQTCCVENIDGMPSEMGMLDIEDENLIAALEVIFSTNSKEKIESDTQTIQSLCEVLNTYNQIAQQITVPDEDWVIERLINVSSIKGMQSVTKADNPDGLLGKPGGYVACVYFSINNLDVSEVPGETIVDKGTDGGGAIEVYASLEDAEARCNYLQEFDGTILYSGSYAIVGTMVIRTSYMLSEEAQLQITDEIVKAFTVIENGKMDKS